MSDIRKQIMYIDCDQTESRYFRRGHASALHAAGKIAADADKQISDLKSRLAVAARDWAAMLLRMKSDCYDKYGYCVFCEVQKPNHHSDCVTKVDHPGSRILERLEQADVEKKLLGDLTELIKLLIERLEATEKVIAKARIATQMVGTGDLEIALAAYDKAEELKP